MGCKTVLITVTSLSFIILAVHIYPSYATEQTLHYPLIMIVPSETCQKVIKYHMKSDCPTDDLLVKYDTSNQDISGHFVTKNGITFRENPQMKNHYLWYKHLTVCVDCQGNFKNTDLFKMIIIEPHGFTWIDKDQNIVKTSWNSYSDRHMAGCTTATIAYSDSLLNDTVQYLESNCTKTSFKNVKNHAVLDHPWEWNNPYSSLHYKATVDNIKKLHVSNCITNKCDLKAVRYNW